MAKTKKNTKQTVEKSAKQQKQTTNPKSNQNNQQAQEIEKMIAENDSVEIKFAWEEINPIYIKELKKIAANLKVKGFRKGHVPPEIAAKEIDPTKVIDAVLRKVLPEAYEKAIKKGGFTPLTDPEFQAISLNKDNDWIIKAHFSQKPEIKLGNWKKIANSAKKKAQKNIDDHNKKVKADAQAKKQSKKSKSTKKTAQKDPQQQSQTPKPLSPQEQKDTLAQAILGALAENIKPAIPSLLIRQNTQRELDNFTNQLKQLNVKIEDFLKARNMTQDQLTMEMFLQSLNKLQVEFIINAIAEEQKIKAEEKDVEERIKAIEDEATRKKVEQDMQYQSYLRAVIAKQKVLDYLLEEI